MPHPGKEGRRRGRREGREDQVRGEGRRGRGEGRNIPEPVGEGEVRLWVLERDSSELVSDSAYTGTN
jgi:hypothetical protein